MSSDLYCMSCVPLRPGVWSIALLQVLKFNAKGKLEIFTTSKFLVSKFQKTFFIKIQNSGQRAPNLFHLLVIFSKAMYSGVRIHLAQGVDDQLRHIISSSSTIVICT